MSKLSNVMGAAEVVRDAVDARNAAAVEAYVEGYTVTQVAVAAGMNATEVRTMLLAHGVKIRPRGTRSAFKNEGNTTETPVTTAEDTVEKATDEGRVQSIDYYDGDFGDTDLEAAA
jgi:hypothetical protein